MSTSAFVIYGATGYTGRLIVAEALAQGLRPVISGRDAASLAVFAAETRLESRPASLDDPVALDRALSGMRAVLHCAGPFHRMAGPMLEACLRNRVHYLDITGEIAVFERMAAADAEAREAGIVVLPGVGFDVVPSDCLAAHLSRRLPDAASLTLAFTGGTGLSRGTATTMVEGIAQGGALRRGGRLVRVPAAYATREIDFGDRTRHCVTIPWGDVSTAFHSTGIPDIAVYTAVPRKTVRLMRLARPLLPLLGMAPMQRLLKARIAARTPGPSAERRAGAQSRLWGEATAPDGRSAQARVVAPDGYTLTALTAVAAAVRVAEGTVAAGFQTPSRAFGADFILTIPGTAREDLP
ncbi:MAG: saccharopine dehydrogenase NADP-binding domain-containing protein [Gemmatimonadaceae bacterium]|nr:saccharopine dehydrogenase NADP-binding domain-containing protein [Gemmatimonadaceae bacterium]MCW5825234.1 saccharopine dehydrogenase NADP-binding domain-containing protein [Gemmatimonadaceae bacterium]